MSNNTRNLRSKDSPNDPGINNQPGISTPKQNNNNKTMEALINKMNFVVDEIKDLKKSVQFMASQYDDVMKAIKTTMEENTVIKKELMEIKDINNSLQHEINDLNKEVNEIKQNQLNKNLIVFGAPKINENKKLHDTIKLLLAKLNINESEIKITDLYQARTTNNKNSAPIIIKMENLNMKNTIIQLAKAKNIMAKDIGLASEHKINICEQLTTINQQLLNESRQLRLHGYKYIWNKNGKIFVRKSENTNIINIKNSNQIESLKTHNITL